MTRALALLLMLTAAACRQAPPPTSDANLSADNVVIEETDTPAVDNEATSFAEADGAHPTAPEPAPIPAKFRGIWAEQKLVCSQLSHPSRLIISGRTLRFPAFVLQVDSIALPDDDSFAVKGHNKKTKAPAEAHYSVDPAGIVLTDEAGGGAERVKCG